MESGSAEHSASSWRLVVVDAVTANRDFDKNSRATSKCAVDGSLPAQYLGSLPDTWQSMPATVRLGRLKADAPILNQDAQGWPSWINSTRTFSLRLWRHAFVKAS